MPIIAEAYYKQISSYSEQHADIQLTSGQICYEAVAADEPAGKHIALARKVSCRLTLNDTNSDFEMLVNYGQAGLRNSQSALAISRRLSFNPGASTTNAPSYPIARRAWICDVTSSIAPISSGVLLHP